MFVLENAKVLTMKNKTLNKGKILVGDDGKIIDVAEDFPLPSGITSFDLSGKVVLPGLIDAHTHLGICEEGANQMGKSDNETTNPLLPQLRALDGINPTDEGFKDALCAGVTAAVVSPGSNNVIGGQVVAVKTAGGHNVDKMILKHPVALKIAMGENPMDTYSQQKKIPTTRMAIAALLRDALVKGENYRKGAKERELAMESLCMVLDGRIPLHVHAHRADDMITAIRVAKEFNVKIVFLHATDGHKLVEELREGMIPAIVGPVVTARVRDELKDRRYETPAILAQGGVKIALMTDHPIVPAGFLRMHAIIAVKEGLSEEEALKSITINPAEIIGVSDRVGSLEKGKDADILVMDGDPLAIDSKVEMVFLNGKKVYSMDNKSTALKL